MLMQSGSVVEPLGADGMLQSFAAGCAAQPAVKAIFNGEPAVQRSEARAVVAAVQPALRSSAGSCRTVVDGCAAAKERTTPPESQLRRNDRPHARRGHASVRWGTCSGMGASDTSHRRPGPLSIAGSDPHTRPHLLQPAMPAPCPQGCAGAQPRGRPLSGTAPAWLLGGRFGGWGRAGSAIYSMAGRRTTGRRFAVLVPR